MIVNRYVRILVILGIAALVFGALGDAVGIVAETRPTSDAAYPVCTAPCECMTEHTAATRWGADGYEYCSKSICGESADAMVQYYCLHQKTPKGTRISTAEPSAPVTTMTSQKTVQTPVITEISVETTATAYPSETLSPTGAATKKSPGSAATILTAIGLVMLAVPALRRK